ncbi:MAG: hypothetical protein WCV69_00320 [Patescibacteria group bacterium]|jgi:hypothetical protein
MNLWEKFKQPAAETPQPELGTEEKEAKIAEIRVRLIELRSASQGAHRTARQYHQTGGIGSSIYKKVGDVSRQIRKLEEELAELTGEPIEPDDDPDQAA